MRIVHFERRAGNGTAFAGRRNQEPVTIPDFAEVTLDGIGFIRIPAGTYQRGLSQAQKAELEKRGWWRRQYAVEMPATTVTITRPFLFGKFEVTQAQWKAIRGEKENPSAFKGDDLPVESVSWQEVKEYCRLLSEKSKARYRLPTEAEWEYAARAGSDGLFPLGTDKTILTPENLGEFCWMNGTAQNRTQPVGRKKPNAFGLYDICGNVWEWCEDVYSPTAYTTLPPRDPLCQSITATERVFRGGCWFLDARSQRAGLRGGNLPVFKSPYVGFRILREL